MSHKCLLLRAGPDYLASGSLTVILLAVRKPYKPMTFNNKSTRETMVSLLRVCDGFFLLQGPSIKLSLLSDSPYQSAGIPSGEYWHKGLPLDQVETQG